MVYDSKQKSFEIASDTWISRNSQTILSQASREKAVLESSATLVEKTAEGVTRGAMKGVILETCLSRSKWNPYKSR